MFKNEEKRLFYLLCGKNLGCDLMIRREEKATKIVLCSLLSYKGVEPHSSRSARGHRTRPRRVTFGNRATSLLKPPQLPGRIYFKHCKDAFDAMSFLAQYLHCSLLVRFITPDLPAPAIGRVGGRKKI